MSEVSTPKTEGKFMHNALRHIQLCYLLMGPLQVLGHFSLLDGQKTIQTLGHQQED